AAHLQTGDAGEHGGRARARLRVALPVRGARRVEGVDQAGARPAAGDHEGVRDRFPPLCREQLFRYTPLPGAASKGDMWKPKVGETEKLSLAELADFPVVEDQPGPMPWITPRHARVVKHVYYFYAPLAFIPAAMERARVIGRPLWYRWLKLIRPLARWRVRHGVFAFPFERWLNDWFGYPLRHGSDDGITAFDDVLPAPEMGQTYDTRAPLQPMAG